MAANIVAAKLTAKGLGAEELEPMDYQAEDVLYLPEETRFSHLLTLTAPLFVPPIAP